MYECPECHLNYKEKEWMDKCEAWCKKHHSCSLEIIAHAIENEKKSQNPIYSFDLRSKRALKTTIIDEALIKSAAHSGRSRMPSDG